MVPRCGWCKHYMPYPEWHYDAKVNLESVGWCEVKKDWVLEVSTVCDRYEDFDRFKFETYEEGGYL